MAFSLRRLLKPPKENAIQERAKLCKSHWSNQWLTSKIEFYRQELQRS